MPFIVTDSPPTDAQRHRVATLLGRKPRGLRAIAVTDVNDDPIVIRVSSVVDDKPFPTLYWLVGAELSLRIDRLEASGWIARLQERVDMTPALQVALREDHVLHKRLRADYMTAEERDFLYASGMQKAFDGRGIGGIADSSRIRCLHTWYAAHLVAPNSVGAMVDALLKEGEYLATD